MKNNELNALFADLATPQIADACVRRHKPLRVAPFGIQSLLAGSHIAGRVLSAQHYGSVDIFFEAFEQAENGDILVIDNQGRTDEGCIGDLTVLEAQSVHLSGMIVWGCHRDTVQLWDIGFPVFSYGAMTLGPVRLDPRPADALAWAQFGSHKIQAGDFVFADEDGVIFVSPPDLDDVLTMARTIFEKERQQALDIQAGHNLREQLQFRDYLAQRAVDPSYSFRQHLRRLGGAIEE
jgi:regulator of RNase E activity RraA